MKSYLSLIPISAKVHRRQNSMTLLCIIIAVFLVTAVFSMADMAVRMEKIRAAKEHGNWHIMLKDISESDAALIGSRPDVAAASWYDVINYKINEDYYIAGKKAALCGVEESFVTSIMSGLAEGSFPQSDREIILTVNVKNLLSVKIGDTVTLKTPNNSIDYKISGFFEDTAQMTRYDAIGVFMNMTAFREICSIESSTDSAPVYYVQFQNHTNIKKAIGDIKELYGLTEENISENTAIMALTGFSSDSYVMGLYLIAGVLFILIMTAGIFMIAGSINSNVAERTAFFGMMRCIGASRKQVIRFVRLEALNWCKAAIPIGVVLGIVITWGLCAVLRLIGSEFSDMPVFGISAVGIVCGIVVGLLTVFFAAQAPAKRAAKVSPVAAVTGNAGYTKNVRHAANTRLSKIETALGIHHAVSAKKNLLLMTGSFAFSIILFLSFSTVLDWTHCAIKPLQPYAPDLSILSSDRSCSVNRDLVADISEQSGVERVFGRMFRNLTADYCGVSGNIDLISYEEHQFNWAEKDMVNGDLSHVMENGNYAVTVFDKSNPLKVGDTIQLDGAELEIAGVLSTSPFSITEGTPTVICSEDTFTQLTGEQDYAVIDIQLTGKATDADADAIRDLAGGEYLFSDRRLTNREIVAIYWAFNLFVYGFLAVIALITVFYIINSISMSVSARMKQYGVMRAVGMEERQVRKMIAAETLTYALSGCIAGCAAGLPLNWFLFDKLVTAYWGTPWSVPIVSIVIILVLVFAASSAAVYTPAKYSLQGTTQGNGLTGGLPPVRFSM